MESQTQEILRHLLSGGTLTALQAKSWYRSMRLAARIDDIKKLGYTVITEKIKTRSCKWVARYSM